MRLRHVLPIAALCLSALSVAPHAHADTPPDVVMLKNGGMLRGTIQEMDPQGNVVVELASGEKRTIAMSEVNYAGPASGAPGAAPAPAPTPPPVPAPAPAPYEAAPPVPPQVPPQANYGGSQPLVTIHGTEARLQLRGEGLTFHRKAGTGTGTGYSNGRAVSIVTHVYEAMCSAPCEVSMPRGNYSLALSTDGAPVEADPVSIDGNGTLEGTYTSRSGTRAAGWVIAGGGAVVGYLLMFSGDAISTDGLSGQFWAGAGIHLGTLVVGMIMAFTPDKAEIRFIPGAPVSLSHPSDLRADSGSRPRGFDPGLSLAMSF